MRVSDPDGKLEDLVFGQGHVKAVEVEERSEQDNGRAFVAVAKGVVRCDAPEQSGCLSDDVSALVRGGVPAAAPTRIRAVHDPALRTLPGPPRPRLLRRRRRTRRRGRNIRWPSPTFG